jgi:hypothetical protein
MQVLDTHNYVTADGSIHHNSGKSYACAAEIMLRAVKQKPSPIDGIKYTRFAIVRNSYPMLKTTTIKTWLELFPEATFGPMLWTPPITHHIRLPSRGDAAGIDCEVIFLALDQPKDVRKLLSLELTGAWVNEARELPKAVIDGLTHRVGRYPTKRDGGATWHGIWMDTNPMDDDHWWFRMAEKERMSGEYAWKFFKQPGGIVTVDPADLPENPEAQDHIFAAGKWWKLNSKAENVGNLPSGYYQQMLMGKNLDWIRCYAAGEYTYVQEGRPVWPEYDDSIMSGEVEYDPSVPLQVGLDFGLTPAAIIGQRLANGRWQILHEIVTFDMGLERFGQQLLAELNSRFPKSQIILWGDPAGMQRDAIYEVTAFDHLRTLGLRAQPTHSNDFKVRREAAAMPMQRLITGKPGLIVSRECKLLRKSLAGGYHFKRIAIGAGQERFRDAPNKNEHSHCFVAGTKVSTPNGQVPIESIKVGDYVNTPAGPRLVTATMSREVIELVELTFGDGRVLVCTKDHPFITNAGVCVADALNYNHLFSCEVVQCEQSIQSKNLKGSGFTESQVGITKQTGQSTGAFICTALYGSGLWVVSRQGSMSTTRTATWKTMLSKILSLFPVQSIADCIMPKEKSLILAGGSMVQSSDKLEQGSGINPLKEEPGTVNTVKKAGRIEKRFQGTATIAVLNTNTWLDRLKSVLGFAVKPVSQQLDGKQEPTMLTGPAPFADLFSPSTGTEKPKPVVWLARKRYFQNTARVYDLTVDDQHQFYANGILVHNCGDAFGYLLLGGGEHRRLTKTPLGASGQFIGQAQATTDFDIFA